MALEVKQKANVCWFDVESIRTQFVQKFLNSFQIVL